MNKMRALAKSLCRTRSWRMTWSSLDELGVLGVWRLLLVGGTYLTCPPCPCGWRGNTPMVKN